MAVCTTDRVVVPCGNVYSNQHSLKKPHLCKHAIYEGVGSGLHLRPASEDHSRANNSKQGAKNKQQTEGEALAQSHCGPRFLAASTALLAAPHAAAREEEEQEGNQHNGGSGNANCALKEEVLLVVGIVKVDFCLQREQLLVIRAMAATSRAHVHTWGTIHMKAG